MNPGEPPTEPPRAIWPDVAPATPAESTIPNRMPPTQVPAPSYDDALPGRLLARRWWSTGRVRQLVLFLLSVLETLLVIRFLLKLLAANPNALFTAFIYVTTELFVAPFEGVFPSPQTQTSVLEFATLLAMIVYALLAWLIVSAIQMLVIRRPARPA